MKLSPSMQQGIPVRSAVRSTGMSATNVPEQPRNGPREGLQFRLHRSLVNVATSSYIIAGMHTIKEDATMAQVKTVGIRELKNQLSAYLREVKAGHRLLVTDRNTVIAELRPPAAEDLVLHAPSALGDWVNAGRITPPRAPRAPLPTSPIRLPDGTARRLIDELRAE